MRMKRMIASVLSLTMAASLLAACGSAAPESTPAPESESESQASSGQVTIKLSTWDYTTNRDVQENVDAFMKANPDIKVDIIDVPAADYTTKLSTMLNGGSDLDVVMVKDADTTYSLYQKNQLLDLTDYVSADSVDLDAYNGLAKNFNFDGKQYALPFRSSYYVMYYNKDIFDAHNMPYPSNDWTWADFEKMAMELADPANEVYGAYLHTWQACVVNWALQDGTHTILDYQTGYDFLKPYYEMALRLQDAGAIQDYGQLKAAKIHYSGAFAQGNVALMPMGSWFMSMMAEKVQSGESKVNWGVATLPHPEGVEPGYVVGASSPIAINAASQKKDAAWKLVKFMTGEEGAEVSATTGDLHARATEETIHQIAQLDGMPEGLEEALKVKHISLDRPVADKVADVNHMIGEEHSMIMLKQDTLDNVLAEMAKRAEDIING